MHSADTILAVDQGKSWSARTCVNLLVFRSQHPSTSSTLHLFPISKFLRQTSKMKLQESTILNWKETSKSLSFFSLRLKENIRYLQI